MAQRRQSFEWMTWLFSQDSHYVHCLTKPSQWVKIRLRVSAHRLFPLPSGNEILNNISFALLSETSHRHLDSWLWYFSSDLLLWLISTTYYPKDHRIKLSPSVLWIFKHLFSWHIERLHLPLHQAITTYILHLSAFEKTLSLLCFNQCNQWYYIYHWR